MSKRPLIAIVTAALVTVLGIVMWSVLKEPQKYAGPVEKLTIATGTGPVQGLLYVAFANGYFRDQGLDAVHLPQSTGKASLQATLEGKADLANPASIPTMHAVLRGEKVYILATTHSAAGNINVVARKDKGITQPSDLKGKKIAVTIGTQGDFFLDVLLRATGITKNEVVVMNLKPAQMLAAIVGGEVDAVATWNPHVGKIRKELEDMTVTFSLKRLFRSTFQLVAKQEYVRANPDIPKKVLRALRRASEFILKSPDDSQDIIAEYAKMDKTVLRELWNIYHFDISLSQALLIDMENLTRWAISNNLTDKTKVPNYLNFIYLDALAAVKPETVTIIR